MKDIKKDNDNEYIFTFGFGHPNANGFFAIKAKNPLKARTKMVRRFGIKWAGQYDAPNAREKAGVNRFGLYEVRAKRKGVQ